MVPVFLFRQTILKVLNVPAGTVTVSSPSTVTVSTRPLFGEGLLPRLPHRHGPFVQHAGWGVLAHDHAINGLSTGCTIGLSVEDLAGARLEHIVGDPVDGFLAGHGPD